jgi:hypothetical protein
MSDGTAITTVAKRKHCPSCGVVIGLANVDALVTQEQTTSNIRVAVSTPKRFNPISWIIRTVMKAEVSHAFFVYWDTDLRMDCVLEAHELGFRIIPLRRFAQHNRIVGLYRVNASLDDGLVWMGDWIGSIYDYSGLLGMAWVMFGRFIKRKWKNPFNSTKAMFCSEMVLTVLKCGGVPWAQAFDAATTTPQDIYLLLEHNAARVGPEVA